jgi:DNA-directed RNA polymerase specialized sigma24 family protein
VAGLTYSEAAAALGVKRGTVMSRVFRAREALICALGGAIATTAH